MEEVHDVKKNQQKRKGAANYGLLSGTEWNTPAENTDHVGRTQIERFNSLFLGTERIKFDWTQPFLLTWVCL